jgi:hypothetical protein
MSIDLAPTCPTIRCRPPVRSKTLHSAWIPDARQARLRRLCKEIVDAKAQSPSLGGVSHQ